MGVGIALAPSKRFGDMLVIGTLIAVALLVVICEVRKFFLFRTDLHARTESGYETHIEDRTAQRDRRRLE
jgi:hypothetical protein